MDTRDETLRPEELLAQLGWVRALARSLVAEPDVSDDVLQQVCLLALQQAPRDARTGPRLRAWLATVTRTLVRNGARGDIRRLRREHRAAGPESSPSTVDIAAHREALKRLFDAVTALEEPYYSVVFARYFDGRSVAEIAELKGLSSAAVRQQLSRARARLRARLESTLADRRDGWFLTALPLASVPKSWTSAPARPLLASLGGLFVAKSMSTLATVLCAVLILGGSLSLGAWYVVRETRPEPASSPVVVAPRVPAEAPADAPPGFASEARVTALDAAAPTPADSAAPVLIEAPAVATLRVHVLDPRGAALQGAEVVAFKTEPRRQLTDADGIAHLAAKPGESIKLAARHPDFRLAADSATLGADAGSVTDLTLQLSSGLQLCLEVQARDGHPIEGAWLRIKEIPEGVADQSRVGSPEDLQSWEDNVHIRGSFEETRTTDGQGRCCVNGVRKGFVAVTVDAPGYVPILGRQLTVDADGGDLGVLVLDPAIKVRGFVVDAAGVVPGALVEVRLGVTGSRPRPDGRESFDELYRRTTTAEDGSFEFDGARAFPAVSSLKVTHPERGRFHVERMHFTEQPTRVVLVPDLFVTFVLSDPQAQQAIDAEATLELMLPRDAAFMFYESVTPSSHRKGRVEAGRIEVTALPYYLETLRLTVPGYDPVDVPAQLIADDADHVLEYALKRPVSLLIRVHAAGSGDLLQDARLTVGQEYLDAKGRRLGGWHTLQNARFDAAAGGYVVTEADLGIATGKEITLAVAAPGYAYPKPLPIATNGQRTCASTLDVYLELSTEPEPVTPGY